MPAPLKIDAATARRFAVCATGLAEPFADLGAAMAHHGFIQIDPINVCGRMQEHIARNRVHGYKLGDLHDHLHGVSDDTPRALPVHAPEERTAFEHFHPSRVVLAAFPVDAWPHLRPLMLHRSRMSGNWGGKLTPGERRLATRILREIGARGALASDDIDHHTRAHNGWTTARTTKVVMDKLFAHGRLLIARRINGRRVYDLPERILPSEVLEARRPSARATARWQTELKLRQHRLVSLKRDELPLVTDHVQPIVLPDDGPLLYCLKQDLPLLEKVQDGKMNLPESPRLLAPLDPLILDRTILQRLWKFEYTWEVYTPAAKRRRGYYALPILAGDRFVGHVDLKADRRTGKLCVVGRQVKRGHRSAPAIAELAAFLGLK